jgi:tripartite motif-containing protein 71
LSSLFEPRRIFIDLKDQNTLYVADVRNQRVMRFKQGEVSGYSMVFEPLSYVGSIFIDKDNNLYVGHGHRLLKQSLNTGNTTIVIGLNYEGSALNQLSFCADLMMNEHNTDLYIADQSNHRIIKWVSNATEGVLIAGISGQANLTADHLSSPAAFVIDSINDALYVADTGNHCIQRFHPIGNATGETVAGMRGTPGDSLLQLNEPSGIIMDSNEAIYIADSKNSRIVKWLTRNYTAGGVCIVGCPVTSGTEPNELKYPYDLKFDSEGNLLVSDVGNHRVQKFELVNSPFD